MPTVFNIPKATLVDLYLNQKLSTADIAQKLKVGSHVTILNYLFKYGIPRRSKLGNRKPIIISKEILRHLYLKRKLSQKVIAKKFGHSLWGIQRKMKVYGIKSRDYSTANTKYPKSNFSGNLLEKAYLIGFRLGDLNIYKVNYLIQTRCSSTIKEQAYLFEDLFKKYGYVNISTAKRGTLEMVVLLNNSFNFLLPKDDLVDKWILQEEKYFLSFLAGYADAEGSYYVKKPYYKKALSGWGVFEIQSYDKNIVSTISKYLTNLYIENTLYLTRRIKRQYKKEMWRVTIVKKQSLWNFIKLIEPYHKHENKLKDLQRVKENLILRNSMPYCRPITF